MELLVLSKEDLLKISDAETLVDSVKIAFSSFSSGKMKQPERHVDFVKGNWWGTMIGFNDQMFGIKIVNVINENRLKRLPAVNGVAMLFSADTGEPQCLTEGSTLTALRTASASVLSTWLALRKKSIGTLGIVGAGDEAFYHAKLAQEFFSIEKIMITARKSHIDLAMKLGLLAVDKVKLLNSADVIFSTTSSQDPVILGKMLKDNFHVSSIGAHTPSSRELDDDVILKARTIMVDSKEAVFRESGDLIIPQKEGLLDDKNVVEIGDIINNGYTIHTPSIFKTVGIASQDVFTLSSVCKKATEEGVGKLIKL